MRGREGKRIHLLTHLAGGMGGIPRVILAVPHLALHLFLRQRHAVKHAAPFIAAVAADPTARDGGQ